MNTKKILGLDLGTNSIGWAVIEENNDTQQKRISHAGSRIIPMDPEMLGNYESGNTTSETQARTKARQARRGYERFHLRRERLNRVLDILGFLPSHYSSSLNRYGQLQKGEEPKIAWTYAESGMQFLFMNSYTEMLQMFRERHPEMDNSKKIPYDWTIYYLRHKALTQALTGAELAWILHQFNAKRGYIPSRADDTEEEQVVPEKKEWLSLKVLSVEDSGEKVKDRTWYNITLENGLVYRRQSARPLEWAGKVRDFIVTTKLDPKGNPLKDKNGNAKISIKSPEGDDWGLLKIKTETDLLSSGLTVGSYIWYALLNSPDQKIIGELVRTIDRKYYRAEMLQIISSQMRFLPGLRDPELYAEAIHALYPANDNYRNSIATKDWSYLLVDDILFYQRPLKTKKYLIAPCAFEENVYLKNNELKKEPLKCVSKSHPLFEEFRLWNQIHNLRFTSIKTHTDVTKQYLGSHDQAANLFSILYEKKECDKKSLFKLLNIDPEEFTWNYPDDHLIDGAPVNADIRKRLKDAHVDINNLAKVLKLSSPEEVVLQLWHMLYSISSKQELEKAFCRMAEQHSLGEDFVKKMTKVKPFDSQYASLSLKAIKRLLPLIREGVYWNVNAIDPHTKSRIEHLMTGEDDITLSNKVREKVMHMRQENDYQGLPEWLAEYIVYGRFAESKTVAKWHHPEDIDAYLQQFRQHSLNNPVVEKVVLETMRVVRDIWKQEGHLDEIHIEMAREMKKTREERARIAQQNRQNEATRQRVKDVLQEMMNEGMYESLRAYSAQHQDKLRIVEDTVLGQIVPDEETTAILKLWEQRKSPTAAQVKKYILWLEQKYQSPYTGEIIPLSKLFTEAYQIEHVIPQSRFFNDSMSNKVICESEVNADKDRLLGLEYIRQNGGKEIVLNGGKNVRILNEEAYTNLVNEVYAKNQRKHEIMMLTDIPDDFVTRQLNDTRYISKLIKMLLSNIVREEHEDGTIEEEATSKNVITTNGTITDLLKHDWGMDDVWNKIILSRFERMNSLTGSTNFTARTTNGHTIPSMPLELQRGFSKKRIDHRHHAMDAIVIACTNRNHVNLLNNECAKEGKIRYDLQCLLRKQYPWKNGEKYGIRFGEFTKPWDTFTQDSYQALSGIIVSQKQSLRVINKTVNNYEKICEDGKKHLCKQEGINWAVRKSLHKATVFGNVNLRKEKTVKLSIALTMVDRVVDRELRQCLRTLLQRGLDVKRIKQYFSDNKDIWADINIDKIVVYYYTNETDKKYYAVRTSLLSLFDKVKAEKAEDVISKVTDEGIQKILRAHLSENGGDPALAFSADGIDRMNQNITRLNGGHPHKPIKSVRKCEQADKFAIGQIGVNKKKFAENDKGSIIISAFYQFGNKRKYIPIDLHTILPLQKEHGNAWIEHLDTKLKKEKYIEENAQLLFLLKVGDLVYVPEKDTATIDINKLNPQNIYKAISFSDSLCYFRPAFVADILVDKVEFESLNKSEKTLDGVVIKTSCLPVNIDRLGNISLSL